MKIVRLVLFLTLSFVCVAAGAQSLPSAITADPPQDKAHPAAMESFQIPSHGEPMNALMYIAAGAGPHPAVILLHGFPGNEKNLDLAQAIRRAGWDVLYFNYRGSWGTPGDFSFTHCTEDVASALAYLRDPANAARLRVDAKHIVLIGHSMGGFMTEYGAAHDDGVMAIGLISAANMGTMAASVVASAGESAAPAQMGAHLEKEGMAPLHGTTPAALGQEAVTHRVEWGNESLAKMIGKRPVLVISSDDGLAAQDKAFADALIKDGNTQVVEVHMATDHAYSDQRIALETAVLTWLEALPVR
jgi:pimeloyl-ACP methyl ester carboxylesterase